MGFIDVFVHAEFVEITIFIGTCLRTMYTVQLHFWHYFIQLTFNLFPNHPIYLKSMIFLRIQSKMME